MEILLLCNQYDAVALALHERLTTLGIQSTIVTAEELQYASLWIHNLDQHGKGFTEIKLQNNKVIHSHELKVVWNRLRHFPMAHFKDETDRYYAQNEMSALYISFLKSIEHAFVYPVSTYNLSIPEDNPLYLKHEAVKAGLNVLDYYFTTSPRWQSPKNMIPLIADKKSDSTFQKKAPHLVWQNQPVIFSQPSSAPKSVWIVGNEILGDKTIIKNNSLKRLALNLKKELVEVQFAKTAEGYKVSSINTFPGYVPIEGVNSLAIQLIKKTVKAP